MRKPPPLKMGIKEKNSGEVLVVPFQIDRAESSRCAIDREDPREALYIARNGNGAHPVLAPVAWIACLLSGVAFWIILIRYLL